MNNNDNDTTETVIIQDGNTTIITNAHGPVNTGSGDQITGDGVTIVHDNPIRGITQVFTKRRK